MKTTLEWVNAAKAELQIESDYALAAALGLSRSCISNYRTGRSFIDEEVAQKIARALRIDVGVILASVAAERAKRPEIKTAWERLAKLAAGTLGALIFSVFPLFDGTAGTANASDQKTDGLYIMRSRFRRWLAAALLLFSGAATADDWTERDTAFQAAYTVLHMADWAQTRYITAHPEEFEEKNRALGRFPDARSVDTYFAVTLALQWLVATQLPADLRRTYQVIWISLEAGTVARNAAIGIDIKF